MQFKVFRSSTFKKCLFKKDCSPLGRIDKDEKCWCSTGSDFHSKLGCCLLLSSVTPSPTTADKHLIASSNTDSPETAISVPVIAPDPLWLSVQFFAPLTCGYCSHRHRWFPQWPFTFINMRHRIKLQAWLVAFGGERAPFCSSPALSASSRVQCFLLLAALGLQAVTSSSEPLPQGNNQEPDLSRFQVTLISTLLSISHWGLLASKFKLTGVRFVFLICLSRASLSAQTENVWWRVSVFFMGITLTMSGEGLHLRMGYLIPGLSFVFPPSSATLFNRWQTFGYVPDSRDGYIASRVPCLMWWLRCFDEEGAKYR